MKVYGCPDEIPVPEIDFKNYNHERVLQQEADHAAKLKAWLIQQGYTGKHTGGIASFGVADGCAQYMLAEGKTSCLIHLPYGDAYNYPDVKFLPKAEIIKRIEQKKGLAELFSKAS
jgi:hypothetical protein